MISIYGDYVARSLRQLKLDGGSPSRSSISSHLLLPYFHETAIVPSRLLSESLKCNLSSRTQRSNEMGAILKALVASWLIRKLLPVVLVIILIVIILIAL